MKGHCFCRTIEYNVNAPPIFTNGCHCRDCQCLTGSAFAINFVIEASNVTVTSETHPITKPEERPDRIGSPTKSMHCPKCGAMLWATHPRFGDMVFVRAGTLEESEKIVPDAHFFVRSKHPWIALPEGVRTFQTLPGDGDEPLVTGEAKERLSAARGASS